MIDWIFNMYLTCSSIFTWILFTVVNIDFTPLSLIAFHTWTDEWIYSILCSYNEVYVHYYVHTLCEPKLAVCITLHVPPCRQELELQSSILYWQVTPLHPGRQEQLKLSNPSWLYYVHNNIYLYISIIRITNIAGCSILTRVRGTVINVHITVVTCPSFLTYAGIRCNIILKCINNMIYLCGTEKWKTVMLFQTKSTVKSVKK